MDKPFSATVFALTGGVPRYLVPGEEIWGLSFYCAAIIYRLVGPMPSNGDLHAAGTLIFGSGCIPFGKSGNFPGFTVSISAFEGSEPFCVGVRRFPNEVEDQG